MTILEKILSTISFAVSWSFKHFSDEIGEDIYVCDFLIMYTEICQRLEELHKSVICFPNEECMKLQNYMSKIAI